MSADPGGGREGGSAGDTPPPFVARKSLLRTPPPPRTYATTTSTDDEDSGGRREKESPMETAAAAAQSVFDSVMAALSPKRTLDSGNANVPGPAKRFLSPEEQSQRKVRRRGARPCLAIPDLSQRSLFATSVETPGTADFRTPCSTEEEEENTKDVDASKASSRTLLRMANKAAGRINSIVRSPASRLNKADSASVSDELGIMLETISHLAIMLGEAEKRADINAAKSAALADTLTEPLLALWPRLRKFYARQVWEVLSSPTRRSSE